MESDKQDLKEQQNQNQEKPQIKKLRVKKLQGSPYVISLEKNDILGEGSFGKVVRAYDVKNPQEDLVAKIIQLNDAGRLQSIQMELKVLYKLPRHNNLVNVKKMKLSSHHKQYFIMEYCNGGTLTDYMKKNSKNISDTEIIDFLQQFCLGYQVLLEQGIIHRDIKPDNILMHNNIFKIADFGLAKVVDSLKESMKISTRGTPLYLAPELIQKTSASAKVDMWSLGVILYKLLFNGKYPFLDPKKNYDVSLALKDVIRNKLVIPKSKRSKELVQLCVNMLDKNQMKRISWEDLFKHPLIQPAFEQQEIQIKTECEQGELTQNGKQLQNSSFFNKQIEILRTSKIKMQPMTNNLKNKAKKIQEIPQNQKNYYTTTDDESQNEGQDAAALLENNHKLLEQIIQKSKLRMKQQEICYKVENYLLSLREKILFQDKVCICITKLIEKLGNEEEVFQYLTNKLQIYILFNAVKSCEKLQGYQNQDHKYTDEEWSIFIKTDNYQMLYTNLYKNDYEYLKNLLINKSDQEYLKTLNENVQNQEFLENQFKQNIQEFLQHFNWLYYMNDQEHQRNILILYTYILELYQPKVIQNFEFVADYLRYYEEIETKIEEPQLYDELMQVLTKL